LVKQITLKNGLLSYHELTHVPVQSWPLSSLVPGILRWFDLPDCFRLLEKKSLSIVAPWNSQREVWDGRKLRAHLRSLGIAAPSGRA